jgi:site-specific DNA recombinase
MKPVAIYARVSSERQKEQETIASQVAALEEYARSQDWVVPRQWQFLDEGYSGASLARPGLDRLRDAAAEGQMETVVVLSPDRLSRKYAYQILLLEELDRQGTEVVFVHSPPAKTPEEQLLLQVQGMIAEYERAQIVERTRRGKRHQARQGSVNVLSGAPYGYRYVKKTDASSAYYEVLEDEAGVVRRVYDLYTQRQESIGSVTRTLNEERIPTRSGDSRWDRSMVWAMLRNPAYMGKACYGKSERRPRQRITRRARQKGGHVNPCGVRHERPREEWIEIPVPALIDAATFELAQDRLQTNQRYSRRRTLEPSLLQGMLVCESCGYSLYRSSGRSTKGKLTYYRCTGADAWRHLQQAVCSCRPARQDYLDDIVWKEVMRLLEEPGLLQAEMERRLQAARDADPVRQRREHLTREQTRLHQSVERLLTAYQENLVSLDELRQRIQPLRRQQNAVASELQALDLAAADRQRYLRLVENMAQLQARVHSRAESMDTQERQKIIRLLVKEVIVGPDRITIRHCLPIPPPTSDSHPTPTADGRPVDPHSNGSYLLRVGSPERYVRNPHQPTGRSCLPPCANAPTAQTKPL